MRSVVAMSAGTMATVRAGGMTAMRRYMTLMADMAVMVIMTVTM